MSIKAKPLFDAQFAPATDTVVYTAPALTRTIIDKFSVCNTDTGTQTITVNIIPSGQSVGTQNRVTSGFSMTTGISADLPEQKNQILNPGDQISVKASIVSKIVIRVSGREIT